MFGAWSGWLVLPVTIFLGGIAIWLLVEFIFSAVDADKTHQLPNFWLLGSSLAVLAIAFFSCVGYFTLQPNEARVLILFGAYRGTVRRSGWHWTNPLNSKLGLSLRLRTLQGERLKVNDKRGNPVEIAAL